MLLIWSLISRLNKGTKKKCRSVLFFGDIAKGSLQEFERTIKSITKERYREDLIEQVYICSSIASRKHQLFKGAVLLFTAGSLSIFVYYLVIGAW